MDYYDSNDWSTTWGFKCPLKDASTGNYRRFGEICRLRLQGLTAWEKFSMYLTNPSWNTWTLKLEAGRLSETSATTSQSARHHIPEDWNFHQYCYEIFKCRVSSKNTRVKNGKRCNPCNVLQKKKKKGTAQTRSAWNVRKNLRTGQTGCFLTREVPVLEQETSEPNWRKIVHFV